MQRSWDGTNLEAKRPIYVDFVSKGCCIVIDVEEKG